MTLSNHLTVNRIKWIRKREDLPYDRSWQITWHTDVGVWAGKSQMNQMPISLELIDMDSEEILVGMVYFDPPQNSSQTGKRSFTTSLDPRFHVMQLKNEFIIYSNCAENLNLRLRILPSPYLKDWAEIFPPGKQEKTVESFVVLGHLQILEDNFNWQFPNGDEPENYIAFDSIGGYGFAAYIDFHMNNGVVSENTLMLTVDRNGNGYPDFEYTGVPESDDSAYAAPVFHVSPNPFNGGTTFSWNLPKDGARRIQIFDVSGQVVRTIMTDSGAQGSILFNGRGDSGLPLPSGVYISKLVGNDGRQLSSGKFTIIK